MDSNLFQNDQITGNSLIGLEFCGLFKEDENILNAIKSEYNTSSDFDGTTGALQLSLTNRYTSSIIFDFLGVKYPRAGGFSFNSINGV